MFFSEKHKSTFILENCYKVNEKCAEGITKSIAQTATASARTAVAAMVEKLTWF